MADKADPTPTRGAPSLQDLCENMAMNMNLKDTDFSSLPDHLQQGVIDKLQAEIARLKLVEKDWLGLVAHCPHLDLKVHQSYARIEPPMEGQEDPYERMAALAEKWSYIGDDDDNSNLDSGDRRGVERPVRWHSFHLVYKSVGSDLELRPDLPSIIHYSYDFSFFERISSQLLLYRLTVVFGMPPPRESDGYKCCWEVELRHSDGGSVLRLGDYKGAANASFYGAKEASDDALQLLNFLTQLECPHTYDNTVAGRPA